MSVSEVLAPLRRSSNLKKIVVAVALVYAILYSVASFFFSQQSDFAGDYDTYMRQASVVGWLPSILILQAAGSTQYPAFERVRQQPKRELAVNMAWVLVVSVLQAALGAVLFAVMEFAVFGNPAVAKCWSVVIMVFAQLVMMGVAVQLLVLLLINLGFSFGQVVPWITIIFVLGGWFLLAFPGTMGRYLYYFWYPVGMDWRQVLFDQVVPFVGYGLLMILANQTAFERLDYIDKVG